ncbi:MAG TPA: ANTAR domain-containing protein, partial [Streptosporangiaceae bacterium]
MTAPSGADFTRLSALIARQRQELDGLQSAAVARSVVDLARGVLMERLRCSPAEAREQLEHLAAGSGTSVAELAAQITGQPSPAQASNGFPAPPGAAGPAGPVNGAPAGAAGGPP